MHIFIIKGCNRVILHHPKVYFIDKNSDRQYDLGTSFSSYYGLDDCVIKAFYQNAPKLGPNPNPQPEPQPPKPEPPQPPTPLLQVLEEIDLIIYYTL